MWIIEKSIKNRKTGKRTVQFPKKYSDAAFQEILDYAKAKQQAGEDFSVWRLSEYSNSMLISHVMDSVIINLKCYTAEAYAKIHRLNYKE